MPGNSSASYDLVGWALEDKHDTTDWGTGEDRDLDGVGTTYGTSGNWRNYINVPS